MNERQNNEDISKTMKGALQVNGHENCEVLVSNKTLNDENSFDIFLDSCGLDEEDLRNFECDFCFDEKGNCIFGMNEVTISSSDLRLLSNISKFLEERNMNE